MRDEPLFFSNYDSIILKYYYKKNMYVGADVYITFLRKCTLGTLLQGRNFFCVEKKPTKFIFLITSLIYAT
jgi:hypothetical protein